MVEKVAAHKRALGRLRSLPVHRYLASMAVTSALARTLGEIPTLPWEEEVQCFVGGQADSVAALGRPDPAGSPEAHAWLHTPGDISWATARAGAAAGRPFILSLTSGDHTAPRQAVRLRFSDECLLSRTAAASDAGDGALLILSRCGPAAIADTGAYSLDLAEFMREQNLEAAVLPGADGQWRSRCHLEQLDLDVVEVCGFETHPDHRRAGWGSRLLRQLNPPVRHLVYVTTQDNQPSVRTARAAGFCPLAIYRKYLIGLNA
ncbi:MAG: hypothetical protein R6U70_08795 [Bacillota bacterium]